MINSIRFSAQVYSTLPEIDLCRDPDDNPILAIALESKADYLVTGDKRDLLSMQRIGLTPIITAAEFLENLG
jgi:hypothetical protein